MDEIPGFENPVLEAPSLFAPLATCASTPRKELSAAGSAIEAGAAAACGAGTATGRASATIGKLWTGAAGTTALLAIVVEAEPVLEDFFSPD
jgi:hypothetical protein